MRGERISALLIVFTVVAGCGGAVAGETGGGGSYGDAAAGGSTGAPSGNGSSGSSASAGGGSSELVSCNDGTARRDCCPPDAVPGGRCAGVSQCSRGGCHDGVTSYLYCGGDGWVAGKGVFPCASSGGGPSGPAACAAAGGQCVLGNASCRIVGPQECNPDRNPGGAFCCLERPVQVSCDDGSGRTDCCPNDAVSGGACRTEGVTCSTRCDPAGVHGTMLCTGGKWEMSNTLWLCGVDGGVDAGTIGGPVPGR